MYENLAIRLDPMKSFLDPKIVHGATSIIMNQLQVSELQGIRPSISVLNNPVNGLAGLGAADETIILKDKKNQRVLKPIKQSDWIPYIKDKRSDSIESNSVKLNENPGNEIGATENYYTFERKLCLRGDEKNQALFLKVKEILEEQKFSDLDIIGRGSYGLVIKVRNP